MAKKATDMGACPVTGLPIVQKPYWTDIRISAKYSVTFQVIGGRILHLLPKGNSATIDVDKLYYHREQVLKESISPGTKIVEIKNCKDIFGSPSPAARKATGKGPILPAWMTALPNPLTRRTSINWSTASHLLKVKAIDWRKYFITGKVCARGSPKGVLFFFIPVYQ